MLAHAAYSTSTRGMQINVMRTPLKSITYCSVVIAQSTTAVEKNRESSGLLPVSMRYRPCWSLTVKHKTDLILGAKWTLQLIKMHQKNDRVRTALGESNSNEG